MSRHRRGSSYDHSVRAASYPGEYSIHWMVDYYYAGSRQRFPRAFKRLTDRAGAERFCHRWGILMVAWEKAAVLGE
jgi:hypothetical protein